ncbi:hypothetical protein C9374_010014 [Naegleria lovaniensis]|uniref:DUF4116 domain-containing protein n=1 Tax=Naegleria lovaniensis TaxID=51637 RepID=A0AA88GJL2_NAELO|nr:uncharacterized protein C9374_010014 [Naegleria lovaniensis]KAG2375391.1 hypothetical protein C9374_010014 [Naegleria lovaniensis]
MKNQILQDIHADLWIYHIFSNLRYLDFISIRLTCKTFYKYLENSPTSSSRYHAFKAFSKLVHNPRAQGYLFNISDHVGLMPYSRSQYSTPYYASRYSSMDWYYLNCEEFEYIIWMIPDHVLKRVWGNLTKKLIYKARVELSPNYDRQTSKFNDFLQTIRTWVKHKPQVYMIIREWVCERTDELELELTSDFQTMLSLIHVGGAPFQLAALSLKQDKEFVLKALDYVDISLKELSSELHYDYDIVLKAVQRDPTNYVYIPHQLKSNKILVLEMIRNAYKLKKPMSGLLSNKSFIEIFEKNVIPLHRSDCDVVELAIRQDPRALSYASESLKKNKPFIMLALSISSLCIAYAALDLTHDRDVCLLALRNAGPNKHIILRHINSLLYFDEDFLKECVTIDGLTLSYAPTVEMTKNKEIVRMALKQNGLALQYAHSSLRDDEEMVREAIEQDGESIMYASEACRNNPEIVRLALTRSKMALMYCSERLREDESTVMYAVSCHPSSFKFASEKLKQDSEFRQRLLNICPDMKFEEFGGRIL